MLYQCSDAAREERVKSGLDFGSVLEIGLWNERESDGGAIRANKAQVGSGETRDIS